MKVAVLVSGGKDSTLTLWIAQQQYTVTYLITVLSLRESTLFQYQTETFMKAYSEATGVPLKIIRVEEEKSELNALEQGIREINVEGIMIGGLLSEYQRTKFNMVAMNIGIPCYAPIWRKNQIMLLKELINNNFEIIISLVAGFGFKKEDVGRKIDNDLLSRLQDLESKYRISPSGEGGEYESLVLNAPFFKKKIELLENEIHFDNNRHMGYLEIKKILIIDKEKKERF